MAPGPIEELALLDLERSNKGASKQRRDQINAEIGVMRDLLPLPESARQRLSQLQIMSLSCVYIRKCNLLQKMLPTNRCSIEVPCEFSSALTGFLLVTTRDGKLVYISENVTEYLGHSMVDMKTQGDSLFDIVDKRDHGTVQAQLLHGVAVPEGHSRKISFFCRMNMSRTLKRQGGFGDVKVMHVKGHFVPVGQKEGGTPEQHVFMALCTPLITPDVKESLIQNNTSVFKSVHKLDMSFVEITETGEYHLGMNNDQIRNRSWYSMLHPEDLSEARAKHVQLIKSRHEMGCMMTVRMLTNANEVIWVNIVMHVRQALVSNSDDPVIVCINQVVSEEEAKQFKIQGQLFALYAARAPDLFFGGHPFHHFQQVMDPEMLSRQQAQAFIQQAQQQHAYYGEQQRFSYQGPQTSGREYPQQPQRYGLPGFDNAGQRMPQGHTSTIKALKRKLQENFISSCKPSKIQRVTMDTNDGGFSDFNGSQQTHYVMNVNVFRTNNAAGDMLVNGSGICAYGEDAVPVMYQTAAVDPVHALRQKKAMLINAIAPAGTPAVAQKLTPTCTLEQVVPEISIPDCYLTPDPSPANSPKPLSMIPAVKQETQEIKQLTSYVISRLNELKQSQTISETALVKDDETMAKKKKNLPVIDATFVDSFFDEIQPAQQREASIDIKVEPLSPEPVVSVSAAETSPSRSQVVKAYSQIATSKLPLSIQLLSPAKEVKGEFGFDNCSDLEELLGLVDTAGPESITSPAYSTESISPAASPSSCSVYMADSSPLSSPFGSNPSLKQQKSLDRMYTDVCPGSVSPGYECRDDILEPDSWLLEPISMSLDMSLADIEDGVPCEMKPDSREDDLYHLKKLLQQSWEPCGIPRSNPPKTTQ